jgi:transcription antitermination factor NusG
MMMAKIEQQLNDPEAADRAFQRWQRDRALEKALREGLERESFPREGGPEARWYVLRVKRRAEQRVAEAVDKLGLTRWVPMTRMAPKRSRHRMLPAYDMPVFEGFVFVHLVGNNYAWRALLALDGVSSILGGENGPVPVPAQNMSAIMKMEEAGVFALARGARAQAKKLLQSDFPIGSAVTIKDGPFAFFDAVVDGYVHTRRVRAMTHLFGREVLLDLEIDQIMRLV